MPIPESFLSAGRKVWITCHRGLVGSAVLRRLWREPCEILLSDEQLLDLSQRDPVEAWLRRQKPDVVFLTDAERMAGPVRKDGLGRPRLPQQSTDVITAAAMASGVATLVDLSKHELPPRPPSILAPVAYRTTALHEVHEVVQLAPRSLWEGAGAPQHRDVQLLASCVFGSDRATFEPPPLLAALFQRLGEAARRGDAEAAIGVAGTLPYGLIHVDDLADAAVFLLENYRGRLPVHCRRNDASLGIAVRMAANLVGYAGDILLPPGIPTPSSEAPGSVSLASLGWSPKAALSDRLRDFYATWRSLGPFSI